MPAAEVPHGKLLDETMAAYERLLQLLTNVRSPELLEANVTMAQMKLLMLVAAGGELAMSEIGAKLGVSLSTVSGLVDRLVDSGYAVRRESREDRRQVLVSTTPA
nr:MarR family transcriptional regulator [Chloroflexota bacterium]